MPVTSSNLPKAGGPRKRFDSVLLRMGFTYAPVVANEAVVSYTALPPLPDFGTAKIRRILTDSSHAITAVAVYFCCTILGVASTGRYPASCPAKPGLSSSGTFRPASRDYLFYLSHVPILSSVISKVKISPSGILVPSVRTRTF